MLGMFTIMKLKNNNRICSITKYNKYLTILLDGSGYNGKVAMIDRS